MREFSLLNLGPFSQKLCLVNRPYKLPNYCLLLNGSHSRMYTPVKHISLSFIAFIGHDIYVQIKQNGTHQSTMFHNIQALLDVLQHSHGSHSINSVFILVR